MDYPYAELGPALRIVVLVFLLVFAIALLGLAVLLAALPGQIAAQRNHPQAASVNLLGWLGLPTGVLWVIAMAWACWNYRNPTGQQDWNSQFSRLENAVAKLEKQLEVKS